MDMDMDMPGYRRFSVMDTGWFYFPVSMLTLDRTGVNDTLWYEIYRLGFHELMVYYGDRADGYTSIWFTHSEDDAIAIAAAWLERRATTEADHGGNAPAQ